MSHLVCLGGHPSLSGPCLSGLNSVGGSFSLNFLLFMFVFPWLSRFSVEPLFWTFLVSLRPMTNQVSQFIVEHFAHFNIHAVQFIGTCAKVTFASEVSKQQVIGHQIVHINGVQSAVRGVSPRTQNVLVYKWLS